MPIPTLCEIPSDVQVISHALMACAGYACQVSAGTYTYLPLTNRTIEGFKAVMRKEFEEIGAAGVLAPAFLNASFWHESGRYETYGEDLYKLRSRDESDFILGPTHEETSTSLARDAVESYEQLPLNLCQIQSKYRDEKRPRNGLFRARELIMKDGYSLHVDYEGLDTTCEGYRKAYKIIFTRAGLDFRGIIGGDGAMDDKGSQEFVAITPDRTDLDCWLAFDRSIASINEIPTDVLEDIKKELVLWLISGEDIVAHLIESSYAANLEMASSEYKPTTRVVAQEDVERVETPDYESTNDAAMFSGVDEEQTTKTLFLIADSEPVVALLVGNDQVNDVKLKNYLGANFFGPASEKETVEVLGVNSSSLRPANLLENTRIVADCKVQGVANAAVGANENGYYLMGVSPGRDFEAGYVDIREVKEGEISLDGRGVLEFTHGIEIGRIFKPGTRYSESMGVTIFGQNGRAIPIAMGYHGIGVSYILLAVIKQYTRLLVSKTPKDAYRFAQGINLPKELASLDIHAITADVKDEEAQALTAKVEAELVAKDYEVLVDDRNKRVGSKLSSSDPIGLPIHVTVSKKVVDGVVKVKIKVTGDTIEVNAENLIETLEILTREN